MKKKHKKQEDIKLSATELMVNEWKKLHPAAVVEFEKILTDAKFNDIPHAMSQRGPSAEIVVAFMKKQGVFVYVDDFKTAELSEMMPLVEKAIKNRQEFITISAELKARQPAVSEPAHKNEHVESYSAQSETTTSTETTESAETTERSYSSSRPEKFSNYTGMNYADSNRFLDGVLPEEFDGVRSFI